MAEQLLSCEHPTSRNPSSKKQGNKPARTAGKRPVQKIKESRSNLNIHVREISADAIRRDRVIDDFLVVDRDLGWSEQRQIGQVPHDDLLEILGGSVRWRSEC